MIAPSIDDYTNISNDQTSYLIRALLKSQNVMQHLFYTAKLCGLVEFEIEFCNMDLFIDV